MDFVSIEEFELYGQELSELLRTEYSKTKKLRFKKNRSINLKH